MSIGIDLPDPPAFAHEAAAAAFEPVDPEAAKLLFPLFGSTASVERLAGSARRRPEGHYRVTTQDQVIFVRLLATERADQFREVVRLVAGLSEAAPVVRVSGPVPVGPRYVAVTSAWLPHRHPDPVVDDIRAIGAALARLHKELAATIADGVLSRARSRRAELSDRLRRPFSARAATMVESLKGIAFEQLDDLPSQILHGDVNPGNILMTPEGVAFCDFESAVYNWGPPVLDLAAVVERMCLTAGEPGQLAQALLAAWRDVFGAPAVPRPGALYEAIGLRNLTAVAVLTLLEDRGSPAEDSEWCKFDRRVAQLASAKPLISAIETAALN